MKVESKEVVGDVVSEVVEKLKEYEKQLRDLAKANYPLTEIRVNLEESRVFVVWKDYSEEEKRAIIEMLNQKRKGKEQKSNKSLPKIDFSHIDKSKILQKLNRERKEKELFDKMAKQRIANKKIYPFHNKFFYKIKNFPK